MTPLTGSQRIDDGGESDQTSFVVMQDDEGFVWKQKRKRRNNPTLINTATVSTTALPIRPASLSSSAVSKSQAALAAASAAAKTVINVDDIALPLPPPSQPSKTTAPKRAGSGGGILKNAPGRGTTTTDTTATQQQQQQQDHPKQKKKELDAMLVDPVEDDGIGAANDSNTVVASAAQLKGKSKQKMAPRRSVAFAFPPEREIAPASYAPHQQQQQQQSVQPVPRPQPPRKSLLVHRDTVVPVAVNETPMIKKNKEMRASNVFAGRRRSSLGLRGKRYYRHIDAEQPDPVRMRQLLVWCAQRAMSSGKSKPGSGTETGETVVEEGVDAKEADSIAKMVQAKIIDALSNKKINTSWYHRMDEHLAQSESIVSATTKIPNPQNVSNTKKLAEFQQTIARFKAEEEELQAALKGRMDTIKQVEEQLVAIQSHLPLPQLSSTSQSTAIKEDNGSQQRGGLAGACEGGEKVHRVMDAVGLDVGLLDEGARAVWAELEAEEDENGMRDVMEGLEGAGSSDRGREQMMMQSEELIDLKGDEKMKEILFDVKLQFHKLHSLIFKTSIREEHTTRRFVEDLFARLLRAYADREAKEVAAVEPMDVLRLLSTAGRKKRGGGTGVGTAMMMTPKVGRTRETDGSGGVSMEVDGDDGVGMMGGIEFGGGSDVGIGGLIGDV
ncbi:hypothetical protein HK102_001324 [Quaeritorhiza haematococci]|nr:hypothetical protein HK102_001324 [Quaeritorhiza haematococci]